MHGLIGERDRVEGNGGRNFYYRNRATLLDARGVLIDYDVYRAQARDLQRQAKQRFLKRLAALALLLWSSFRIARADARHVIVSRNSATGDVQTRFRNHR